MKFNLLACAAVLFAAVSLDLVAAQTAPDGGPPPNPDRQARMAKLHAACQADIDKLCPGLDPGRPTFQCIREHHDAVSDSCKTALASAWAGRPRRGDGSGPPPPPSDAGVAPPSAPPPPSPN